MLGSRGTIEERGGPWIEAAASRSRGAVMIEARTDVVRRRAGVSLRLIAATAALALVLGACSTASIPTIADAPPTPQPERQTLLSASEQREHLRILAAYGGVYRDPRVQGVLEKTVDKLVG